MTPDETSKPKILITGGCGKIGSYFVRSTSDRYYFRVVDKTPWDVERLGQFSGQSQVADLQDPNACRAACAGMDYVIHLAADPDPEADFLGSLLGNNILASYHLFQAAKEAGCKRLLYASSIHAVAAYPQDLQIQEHTPVRPTSMYGVSKCFGEALCAHYGVNEGLPSIAIRIGAYLFPDELHRLLPAEASGYLHPDDFNQLLVRCLETPDITFAVVHAISDNRFKRFSIRETQALTGYHPQADVFAMLDVLPQDDE